MANVNHGDRKHALLSASGSSKWINCTPSARMEDQFKSESSTYADEGTLAHEFADIQLRLFNKEIDARYAHTALAKLRKNKHYSDEMEMQVEKYTDYVKETYLASVKKHGSAELSAEKRVDYSAYVPEGFGTNDAAIIADYELEITDLKYGKGVPVYAEDNTQLMIYALGAYLAIEMLYEVETIKMTIVQPRLDSISSSTIAVEDLLSWADDIKKKAELAYRGEGTLKVGSWCRWCKAKASCPAFHANNYQIAVEEFAYQEPELLSDKEILKVYAQIAQIKDWVKAVESHVKTTAKTGKKWKGYKVVHSTGKRKWLNDESVKNALLNHDVDYEMIVNEKVKGITDISNLLGKDRFDEIVGHLVIKPQGAPTVVPEDDKRPAIGLEQALEDFAEPID